jgi:drug/metabolite transporter (DMT)-like permease
LILAWTILGEKPSPGQLLGFALTLGGGLAVSLMKNKKP